MSLRHLLRRRDVATESLPWNGAGGIDGLSYVKQLLAQFETERAVRPPNYPTVGLSSLPKCTYAESAMG